MELSEKEYSELKSILKKEGANYKTEAEYKEAANNLVQFVELAYSVAKEEHFRQQRLKDEPEGFAFQGEGRTCTLCHLNVMDEMWYDKWGMKCMNCHEAFRKKIVPGYVFADRNNQKHIADRQLSWRYKIHLRTLQKLVREGQLKARQVPNDPSSFSSLRILDCRM